MKRQSLDLKIINVAGARPNFMKIAPLMEAYRKVPGIQNASDISPRTLEGALDRAGELVKEGADAILLACAGLAAIGLARQVYERFNVIALDPVHAAGALTHHILSVTRRRIPSDG